MADLPRGFGCAATNAHSELNGDGLVVTATSFTVLVGTLALLGFLTSSLSISLKRANRQLHYLGTHDALTNLPNRQQLSLRIAQAVAESARSESPFAVLFVDLDGFKSINDSLGHRVGDDLLQVCAERLRHDLRHTDMVARLGGDEFVIVVDDVVDASSAAAVANAVLRRLSQEIVVNGLPLRVSASIGIAIYPHDGDNADELLHSADAAMYAAKQSGRNTFRMFEPEMQRAQVADPAARSASCVERRRTQYVFPAEVQRCIAIGDWRRSPDPLASS
ncbi:MULTISPECIES: GGDEF domain-containing protein [Paraburkholderia]|uniref:GGDEF domain-containing protein n=1 Tax=Paraburkholderia TaxID=1822464 RepID=UPI001FE60B1A|nr:GGDEF domain-containing protein [Paraburkholderia podalyriae]